jgi:hypothetical protein
MSPAASPAPPPVPTLPAEERIDAADQPLVVRRPGPADLDALIRFYDTLPPMGAHNPFPAASRSDPEPTRGVDRSPGQSDRLIAVYATGAVVADGGWQRTGDGDGELDLVVAPDEHLHHDRLAGFLLDALIVSARAAGIRNLRTTILVNNGPMLALLHERHYAALGHEDHTVAHVSVAVGAETPEWAPGHDRPRVLIEGGGLGWIPMGAIRSLDVDVRLCPGPRSPAGPVCPILEGRPCPLVEGADAVICAVAPDRGRDRLLADHRARQPARRLFVTSEHPPGEPGEGGPQLLGDDQPPLEAAVRAMSLGQATR